MFLIKWDIVKKDEVKGALEVHPSNGTSENYVSIQDMKHASGCHTHTT